MRLHLNFLPITIVALVLFAGVNSVNASQDSLGPKITIPQNSGDKCILSPSEMRRKHPDMLKHDRILTLRQGIRATADGKRLDGSLKQCINCHAIKDETNNYVRINNDQHFCVSCHKYAAVSIDCFQCHRDIPEGDGKFHALSSQKNANYTNVVPGKYHLTVQDIANIAPEGHSDDR